MISKLKYLSLCSLMLAISLTAIFLPKYYFKILDTTTTKPTITQRPTQTKTSQLTLQEKLSTIYNPNTNIITYQEPFSETSSQELVTYIESEITKIDLTLTKYLNNIDLQRIEDYSIDRNLISQEDKYFIMRTIRLYSIDNISLDFVIDCDTNKIIMLNIFNEYSTIINDVYNPTLEELDNVISNFAKYLDIPQTMVQLSVGNRYYFSLGIDLITEETEIN